MGAIIQSHAIETTPKIEITNSAAKTACERYLIEKEHYQKMIATYSLSTEKM